MFIRTLTLLLSATLALGTTASLAAPAPKGKVLVVLSSEAKITLLKSPRGSATVTHPTGFFLSELMVPLNALIQAGYEPVFSNPKGTRPVMDKVSDGAFWFGGNAEEYQSLRKMCEELGACGPQGETRGSLAVKPLKTVIAEGLDGYAGVFFPGGHAPMEDLWKNPAVGQVLKYFHQAGKPTALICHGPIALLAALDDPSAFAKAVKMRDAAGAAKLAAKWPYRGYTMTVFSTLEEQQEEPGQDNALGGFVPFYPDQALNHAAFQAAPNGQSKGGVNVGPRWTNHVVRDRELITGQNPFSDKAFAASLIAALEEKANKASAKPEAGK